MPNLLKDDLSEIVQYDFPDYPLYARRGLLSLYPNYAAPIHFHDDLELISVLSGEMQYNVNGEILNLQAGDGIFVNSRQLHYGFSDRHRECDFICVLMHPMLLCITPAFERDFVTPLLGNESVACVKLSGVSGNTADGEAQCQNTEPAGGLWQRQILEKTAGIYFEKEQNPSTAPLWAQAAFLEIWRLLYEHSGVSAETILSGSQDLSILKTMVSFLQRHYAEKLTLADIAAAGAVGQSKCCRLFSRYLRQSPNVCLNEYRLNRSAALLRKTGLTVTEIAEATGFGGSSYFAEVFHRWSGQTPGEYRRAAAQET